VGKDARPRHPGVDRSIEGYVGWQAALAGRVRQLAHDAEPEMLEEVRYGNRPYFLCHGVVCALQSTRDHLNVFLYDGGRAPDPKRIITDGFENATARQIKLYEGDSLDEDALRDMLRWIATTNRAGGWRALPAE
jgi:hypothetical protein